MRRRKSGGSSPSLTQPRTPGRLPVGRYLAPMVGKALVEEASTHLEQVRLQGLMARSTGIPQVAVALLDGPVAMGHPNLAEARIHTVDADADARCRLAG